MLLLAVNSYNVNRTLYFSLYLQIEVWCSIISTIIVVALINKFLNELHKRIIKTTAEDIQTKSNGIAATLFQSYGNMTNQGKLLLTADFQGTEKSVNNFIIPL